MMMHRLRYRFYGLYTDYSTQLWVIIIIQALSLAIGLSITIITNYDQQFVLFFAHNWKRLMTYHLIRLVFTIYVPILTQLSSLIFGYIRYKKDKLIKNKQGLAGANMLDCSLNKDDYDADADTNSDN